MEQRTVIFHVDVNSAFLSWSALEQRKVHPDQPDLRDIPSAVGGDVATRHGVITAKSIPAKKYKVRTGEPVVKALQKCPGLVLVSSDFHLYREFSHKLMEILSRYANAVDQVSIDEAYLDVTVPDQMPVHVHSPRGGFRMEQARTEHIPGDAATPLQASVPTVQQPGTSAGPQVSFSSYPLSLSDRIRREVYEQLGFTVNVGISSNRLLAKTASDFVKPGRIHTLWPEEIPGKLWPLPIGELHGCGGKSAARLNDFGIRTIGDAAHADLSLLQSILGEKGGLYIHQAANGISSSVVSGERDDAKSYSNETTVPSDISFDNYEADAFPVIRRLAVSVSRRLKRDGVFAGTIEFSVKTDDFHRHSRQSRISPSTNDAAVIEREARKLAVQLLSELFAKGRTVRLIGVGGSSLDHGEYRQLDLFQYAEQQQREEEEERKAEKKKHLDAMLQKVQRRYGEDALHKGFNGND